MSWKRMFHVNGKLLSESAYIEYLKEEAKNQRVPASEREEYDFTYRKGQCRHCGASLEVAMPSGSCGNCGALLTDASQDGAHHEVDFDLKMFSEKTDQRPITHRG